MPLKEGEEGEREPEYIKVGQDEWKVIEEGAGAETSGLGPCIGIVIHDTESKKAIVGHFSNPDHNPNFNPEDDRADEDDSFLGMVERAKKLFKDPKKVVVYIGGGGYDISSSEIRNPKKLKRQKAHTKRVRSFVEEKLKESGFENLKIQYHNADDTTIMIINTDTGVVNYDTHNTLE